MKHRVSKWMKRVGQEFSDDCDWVEEARAIFPRLYEEMVREVEEAFEERDVVKFADAIKDAQFVLAQWELLLESKGVDMDTCGDLICDNNDEKYSTSKEYVENWLTEWQQNDPWFASKLYVSETWSVEDGCFYYCLKDDTGKVRKSKSHVAVNLLPCIPKELLND